MRHLCVGIGLVLTICGPVLAQKESTTDSIIQYDHSRWKLIKQLVTTFDATVGPASVVLLRSRKTTGTGGVGQPLNDVDLLIQQGGRVIYDFSKGVDTSTEPPGTWFYMDDYIEIKDVTLDGVSEVLFHSGFQGASGFTNREHILRYDKSKASIADIAPATFFNSGRHGVRWLRFGGWNFAVIAGENWPPATPFVDRCHYCPSPFRYDVYQWSNRKSAFEVYRQLFGQKPYSEAYQALDGDWALIQSGLSR